MQRNTRLSCGVNQGDDLAGDDVIDDAARFWDTDALDPGREVLASALLG